MFIDEGFGTLDTETLDAVKDQITKNALNTFHGPLVGGHVLSGTVERPVLGRVVNEVARTADMTKTLNRPAIVSDEVARRSSRALANLGLH
jgi:hypothetical protein